MHMPRKHIEGLINLIVPERHNEALLQPSLDAALTELNDTSPPTGH